MITYLIWVKHLDREYCLIQQSLEDVYQEVVGYYMNMVKSETDVRVNTIVMVDMNSAKATELKVFIDSADMKIKFKDMTTGKVITPAYDNGEG